MVKVKRGEPEPTDRFEDWPPAQWPHLLRVKRDFLAVRLTHDCRCLSQFVREAHGTWKALGYASVEEMIGKGLDLETGEILAAYDWLLLNDPKEAVPLKEAAERGRALRDQKGRPKDGEVEKPYDIRFKDYGTRATYLRARLERDAAKQEDPEKRKLARDALTKLEGGEIKSVRQAAIAAEIIREPTLREKAEKAFLKLDARGRQAFLRWAAEQ